MTIFKVYIFASVCLKCIIASFLLTLENLWFASLHSWVFRADQVNYGQRRPDAECVSLSLKLFTLSQSFMPLNPHKTLFTQRLTVVIPRLYARFLPRFYFGTN